MNRADALAAALMEVIPYAVEGVPIDTDMIDTAERLCAALAASGWTLVPTQPAPDSLRYAVDGAVRSLQAGDPDDALVILQSAQQIADIPDHQHVWVTSFGTGATEEHCATCGPSVSRAAALEYTGPTGPTRRGTAEAAAQVIQLLGWINFPQVIHDSIGSAFDRSMDTHDQTCQGVADAILAELRAVAGEPAADALRVAAQAVEAILDKCDDEDEEHLPPEFFAAVHALTRAALEAKP